MFKIKGETLGFKIFNIVNILIMVLLMVVMLFPYLNVVAKAFNTGVDTQLGGITIFPRKFTFENMQTLLEDKNILNSMFISISRVIAGTVISLVVQFAAAYAFTKKQLKGRGGMLVFLMLPLFFTGGLIPQYLLFSSLKIINTFWVYILPGAFSIYSMVIMRTYLYTIPESIEESARLDGANELVVLIRLIIPLSMPIIATITLWSAVGHWNDWVTTLYFITKSKLFTLQYVLMQLLREAERIRQVIEDAIRSGRFVNQNNTVIRPTPEALQCAQIVLTTIPIIILYPFLQKYFIKGIMIGAIKD